MVLKRDVKFLAHFGVKGMRWGVRNDPKPTGTNQKLATEVKALRKERTAKGPSAAAAQLMEPDGAQVPKVKGWRPTKKQIAMVAIGAAATGAIVYELKTGNISKTVKSLKDKESDKSLPSRPTSIKPHSVDDYLKASEPGSALATGKLNPKSGVRIGVEEYKLSTQASWERAGENGISKYHFDIPEKEYPPGHSFYRFSTADETTYSKATYMTSTRDDVPRYALSFARPGYSKLMMKEVDPPRLISFKATEPIRTPDLKTRLDALHTVIATTTKTNPSPADVLHAYEKLTLTKFQAEHADDLFAELKKRGYSAMIDDNNVGIIGESPMILFDSTRVSPKSSEKVTEAMYDGLIDSLTDIPHRV